MKMLLSEALERVGDGSPKRGEVRIDGQAVRLFRSKGADKVVWSENSLFAPETFIDQEVEFDGDGVADVRDVQGRVRQVQIRVLVPWGPLVRTMDLICPPDRAG
jgi:hypothetical protein